MATGGSLTIIIKGDDQASDDLRRVRRAIQGTDDQADSAAASTQQMSSGFSTAQVAAAGAAAAVLGLVKAGQTLIDVTSELIVGTADYGDEVAKAAKRTGLATDAYQELSFAAQIGGATQQDLERSVRRLQRATTEAGEGVAEYGDAFDRLGISARDSEGRLRSFDDLLPAIAESFAASDNATRDAATAQDLFGRSGTKLLPLLESGREGIEALRMEARQYGAVLSEEVLASSEEFQDQLLRLESRTRALKSQIGGALLPVANALIDVFLGLGEDIHLSTEELRAFAFDGVIEAVETSRAFFEVVRSLTPAIAGFAKTIAATGLGVKAVGNAFSSLANLLAGSVLQTITSLLSQLETFLGVGESLSGLMSDRMAGAFESARSSIGGFRDDVQGLADTQFDAAGANFEQLIGDVESLMQVSGADLSGEMTSAIDAIIDRANRAQTTLERARASGQRAREDVALSPAGTGGDGGAAGGAAAGGGGAGRDTVGFGEDLLSDEELEGLRGTLSAPATQAKGEIQAARTELQKFGDQLQGLGGPFSRSFGQMTSSIGEFNQSMEEARLAQEAFGDNSDALMRANEAIVSAMGAGGQAVTTFMDMFGASAKQQAGVMAVFETAMGLANLFVNPAAAAAHFAAAAQFGLVAGGVIGDGAGGGGAGGGGGRSGAGGAPDDVNPERERKKTAQALRDAVRGEPDSRTVEINVDARGATHLSRSPDVARELMDAVEREAGNREFLRLGSG